MHFYLTQFMSSEGESMDLGAPDTILSLYVYQLPLSSEEPSGVGASTTAFTVQSRTLRHGRFQKLFRPHSEVTGIRFERRPCDSIVQQSQGECLNFGLKNCGVYEPSHFCSLRASLQVIWLVSVLLIQEELQNIVIGIHSSAC